MRHIVSRVRRHTPTLSILLIVFSSIVGVAVILSSSLISNKNTENRSKAADGTVRTVKLVNRPYDGTSKYFLFDGIIENGVTIEQNSNRFTYSGTGWTQGFQTSLASGGSTSYTGGADDAVTFTTTYDEFTLITYKGQGYGSFEVYVDGQYRETIETTAASANWQVFDTIQIFPLSAESKLPAGTNKITLTNIPQGTNTYFLFDGIVENGVKVEQNSSRFTYSGSWTRDAANTLASGGSASYTSAADGTVSFTTTASIVTLITNLGPGYGSLKVLLNDQEYGTLYNTGPSSIRWQYKYTLPIGLGVVRPSPPAGAKLVKLVNKPSGTNAYVLFDGITDSGIFYNDDSYRVQYQSVAQQPSTNVWNYSVLLPLARGGTAAYTGGSGDSVSFYTTSPEVQLTTYKGPGHGSYDLYVDNQFKQNIPLTAATGVWQTTITLPISPIQPVSGEKTVRIVNHPLDDTNKNIIFDGISENGRVTQEDSQRFTYSGTWTSYGTSTASGGSLKYATTPSAEVQFKTTADEVKIITYKGPTYGAFDVYVDGVRKQTVRTLATDTTWKYETTISLAAPPAGSKQVRLVNKPLGTGAAYMLFDGIVENNTTIEQDSSRFSYLGTGWTSVTTAAASGNSTIYTANQGDEVLFYTTANTITLTSYKGPSYGSIDVYVDGVYRENIIMLGSTAQWRYAIPLQISPLPTPPAGSKQVRLVNRPTSSSAKYFFFDAIGENTTYTQQDDRRFTYVGSGWNKAIVGTGYSAGTASLGSFDGDEVSFYTTSPEVAVYTAKGPLYGSLDVYVDGILRQNIRLTDATASLTPLYIAVDPDAIHAADQRTKRLRVLEVRYFPPGVDPLYNPDILSSELRSLLSSASRYHGYANPTAQPAISVEIVQVINRYTARPNPNNTWYKTTEAILAQDNLCKIIHDKDIDQVWLWVDPRAGVDTAPGLEYIHSGNYFKTGSAVLDSANPPFCNGQDSFVVMGFDDSRTSDLALHSFGHYMESLIGNVLGSDLFWNRYAGNNATNRALRCGNVHFPPNGAADYDYSNQTYVQTSCEDWNPDATGTKKTYNCSRWGCTQGGYLVWWMQNFPNINNPFMYNGKKIPNWWDFTVDFDDAVQSYNRLGYHLNTSFFSLKYAPNLALDSVSTKIGSGSLPDKWVHTTQGSKRLFTVQVSYQAKTDPQAKVSALSYAGKPMTFLRRDKNGDTTNEIWQLLNPPEGSYFVSATFTANPGEYAFVGTSFGGVNQTTPILTHASNSSSSATQNLQLSGSTGSLGVGFVTTYPDGGTNLSQSTIGTSQWSQITSPRNIQSNGVLLPGGTLINFTWNTPKVYPWTSSGFVVSPTRSL